jgi:hypothetical protein
LAEHELCKLGVTGSSPVASTSLRDKHREERRAATPKCADAGAHTVAGIPRVLLVSYGLANQFDGFGVVGRVAQLVRARP